MTAQLVADPRWRSRLTVAPSFHSARVLASRLSVETSTANQSSPFSTTVRQTPAWLIEGADIDRLEVVTGFHLEPAVAIGVADGADAPDIADDAGEHQIPLVPLP